MAGVRRVTRSILRYYVLLLILAIVAQIFLAAQGIFGGRAEPIEEASILDPHREFGHIIGFFGAILLLVLALLAWLPHKAARWWAIALPFILFIQTILPAGGRWIGALHVLNAFFIVGVIGWLTAKLWRPAGAPAALGEKTGALP